jgi:hypothetical protein
MTKKVSTTWWVHPVEGHTNEVIALHLRLPPENAREGILYADGSPRDMWSCASADVTKLRNSQAHVQAKFRVYKQRGGERPRLWPFPKKTSLRTAIRKGLVKKGSDLAPVR